MHKALEQMNIKLSTVLSDVTGTTGMAILRAIVAGERDPKQLAQLRQTGCKNDKATITLALEGTWQTEHLFELRHCLEVYDFFQAQIAACDVAIEAQLKTMAVPAKKAELPAAKSGKGRRRGNAPHFDARRRLY